MMAAVLARSGPWTGTDQRMPPGSAGRPMARAAAALRRWFAELRIDVDLPGDDLEDDLRQLHVRWFESGAALDGLDGLGPSRHGLLFKTRHADGEQFIYVIDPARCALAAYVVLGRLVEVNRRVDSQVRSPHAKVARAYRRMGITSQIYRWWLDGGRNLMSGERQSPHAHALWMALARDYALAHVRVQDRQVHPVGADAPESTLHDLGTRMVLLGRGRTLGPIVGA